MVRAATVQQAVKQIMTSCWRQTGASSFKLIAVHAPALHFLSLLGVDKRTRYSWCVVGLLNEEFSNQESRTRRFVSTVAAGSV